MQSYMLQAIIMTPLEEEELRSSLGRQLNCYSAHDIFCMLPVPGLIKALSEENSELAGKLELLGDELDLLKEEAETFRVASREEVQRSHE